MGRASSKSKKPAAATPASADSSQTHPAPVESDARTADADEGRKAVATAETGAQAPATDTRGAGEAAIAVEGAESSGSGSASSVAPLRQTIDVVGNAADVPAEHRAAASLVVTSRQPQRRRAGRVFGRHDTVIPLTALSAEDIEAIESDPVLRTVIRVATAPRD